MTEDISTRLTAAFMFIDNSNSSIDGDYNPTRISAQKETVESFCSFFYGKNRQSVFGFGCLADSDFGIKVSFTQKKEVFPDNLRSIKTGGKILLDRAIRCGILAMNQRPKDIQNQVLIFLIGSKHDLTNERAETIANTAYGKGISINIFVFGDEEIDEEPLKLLIEKMGVSSHYNRIPNGSYSLSSIILNQYCTNFNTNVPPSSMDIYINNDTDDPELRKALAMSMQDQGIDDPDIQAAIQESMKDQNQKPPAEQNQPDDDEMDPELRSAIELSKQTGNDVPNDNNNNTQKEIDDLVNDPDQLNDILTEFQGTNSKKSQENKKDDKDDKDKDQKK